MAEPGSEERASRPAEAAAKTPYWYRFAWFLGRPPPLTARQWRTLGLVSAVGFFEMYDMYLLSLNLKQIQDELAIAESSLGLMLSFIRSGALFALLILPFADRFGRRRVLLWTIAGYTIATGLTALAPDTETFVALQFLARVFGTAETLLAIVVIVEEFGPEHRGWGIGAAAAIQSAGAGFAALMFGFVELMPFGWRSLYAVGIVPLVFIAYWRRALPETGSFLRLADASALLPSPLPMFGNLARIGREHGRAFTLLSLTFFCVGVSGMAAGSFAPKYLQEVHGWAPSGIATLNLLGGMLAVLGNPLAGRLSDRFGRRPVGALFAFGYGVAILGFYSIGIIVPLLWIAYVFFSMGTDVTLAAYRSELFPTSMRASASGATNFVAVSGGIVGLLGVSVLFGVFGSTWTAILVLGCISLLVPVVIWLLFPETAGRSLDEIAPERLADVAEPGPDPPPP